MGMRSIGVIGVGHIGKRFVDGIRDAGYEPVAFDSNDAQLEYVIERGGTAADSPVEVVDRTDVVLLALPGTPEVEATFDAIESRLREDHLIIDATTTHAEASVVCAEICADRGARFIEAPLTRAAPRPGMHMFIGGEPEAYEAAKPILETVCDVHLRIGDPGDATIFKYGLQIRYAGQNALDAEVVSFLRDRGIDPEPMRDVLEMNISDRLFTREYDQAIEGLGGLRIWTKDVGYALDTARKTNSALPLAATIHDAYKATVRQAGAEEGHAATVLEHWRSLNGADDT